MQIKNQLPLQRLIGKIDNDFNIDNSDWIPRVAAWVTDALSQLKILPMEKKTMEVEVHDRIAMLPCEINPNNLEITDKNGCKISEADDDKGCECNSSQSSSTGRVIGITPDGHSYNDRLDIANVVSSVNRNYVISNDNQIELNFDTDYIIIKSLQPATYYDEYYNTEVPYIYDNGLLLEALAWYCLFKMLSRVYKHQVYSISSGQPYLNPYQQWISLKTKAKNSVLSDLNKNKYHNGWNNFFFNSTFRPRD